MIESNKNGTLLAAYEAWRKNRTAPRWFLLNLELMSDDGAGTLDWGLRVQIAAGLPVNMRVLALRLQRARRLQCERNRRRGAASAYRSREAYRDVFFSLPERAFIQNYLSESEFIERAFDVELRRLLQCSTPAAELRRFLETLRSEGCKIVALSNSPMGTDGLRRCCKSWKLDSYFENYFVSSDSLFDFCSAQFLDEIRKSLSCSPEEMLLSGIELAGLASLKTSGAILYKPRRLERTPLGQLFVDLVQQGPAEIYFLTPDCGSLVQEFDLYQQQLLCRPVLHYVELDGSTNAGWPQKADSVIPALFVAQHWDNERRAIVQNRLPGRQIRFFSCLSSTLPATEIIGSIAAG